MAFLRDVIDALSDYFNVTLTDILDKHAPLKTRIMIHRPKIPWFNDDIKQLKRKRCRLVKKALKTDLPGDWNNYHKVRNHYSALLKSARVNYSSSSSSRASTCCCYSKGESENFSSLSIGEVCRIVRESSNASCWLDPVPTWLVKSCLDVLAPSITEMVTLNFELYFYLNTVNLSDKIIIIIKKLQSTLIYINMI